jgi:histidine triad (HIT) family protein
MRNCIFCNIAKKEMQTNVVYEDDRIICFEDAGPVAPVHVLMIPKQHISSIDDVTEKDQDLLGYMMIKVPEIAKQLELDNGYRLIINNGDDGMQTVKHLHIHIMGKRQLTWPPG